MSEGFLSRASEIYAYAFFGTVMVIALVEWAVPRRRPGETLALRWFGNVAIWILDSIAIKAVFPLGTIAWAVVCAERGWGLLHAVAWPAWLGLLITAISLDLVNYGQHYLLHRIPLLWRLHRTHHSDAEFDFTTGLRFHPVESLFTTSMQLLAIFLLGASPLAVLAVQLAFVAISFIEHGNLRVPAGVDRFVRLVFVTPDMHRIHHSQATGESQANFSNLFSWWDRLFRTYVHAPAAGHDGIVFGLPEFTGRKHATLPWMLVQPFLSESEATTAANAEVVVSKP
jgi:sterol desaturase/sphingolipid hydroxylase (fatty acid hydroxylase superfamily)